MANTLIPIQTYTLAANGTSITFSNIPQNYTDLKIAISGRNNFSGDNLLFISINGSNSLISSRWLVGGNTSAAAATSGNAAAGTTFGSLIGRTSDAGSTASTFGSAEIHIPNYTSSNLKTILTDSVHENSGTLAYVSISANLWASTAAVTSVTVSAQDGWLAGSTFTLYGISNGVKATGGTLTVAGGYAYHTFTSTGSFLPNQQIKGAEVLAIAGGGGSTGNASGGGGAGGLLYAPYFTLNAGTSYTALVGAGGSAGTAGSTAGTNGSSSIFSSLSSTGGGFGGGAAPQTAAASGGSGGGGYYATTTAGIGVVGQGNNGGVGFFQTSPQVLAGGGGGGAGAAGTAGNVTVANGGNGGIGSSAFSIWGSATGTGQNVGGVYYYAGGGGGGRSSAASAVSSAPGGYGGGGNGGYDASSPNAGTNGTAGTANTGGGAGGVQWGGAVNGLAGGSGLIIVRYPLS